MGVLGLLVPEADGGLGLTDVDLVLLLEESGRAGLPDPLVEHAAVGVPLLDDAARAAAGEVTITAVFADEMVVPWGDERRPAAPPPRTAGLYLAERAAVTLDPGRVGRRRPAPDRVEWDAATATVLDPDGRAGRRSTAPRSAPPRSSCGLADRMLDMTVDYAKERTQFGVPIGSFQAVKHHLADARSRSSSRSPLVYRAAYSLATGDAERRCTSRWRRPRRRRPRCSPDVPRCSATARSATRSSTTCTCS